MCWGFSSLSGASNLFEKSIYSLYFQKTHLRGQPESKGETKRKPRDLADWKQQKVKKYQVRTKRLDHGWMCPTKISSPGFLFVVVVLKHFKA